MGLFSSLRRQNNNSETQQFQPVTDDSSMYGLKWTPQHQSTSPYENQQTNHYGSSPANTFTTPPPPAGFPQEHTSFPTKMDNSILDKLGNFYENGATMIERTRAAHALSLLSSLGILSKEIGQSVANSLIMMRYDKVDEYNCYVIEDLETGRWVIGYGDFSEEFADLQQIPFRIVFMANVLQQPQKWLDTIHMQLGGYSTTQEYVYEIPEHVKEQFIVSLVTLTASYTNQIYRPQYMELQMKTQSTPMQFNFNNMNGGF